MKNKKVVVGGIVVFGGVMLSAVLQAGLFDSPDESSSGERAGVSFSGLVDTRYVHTSKRRSVLYQVGTPGPNKLRYGGKDINLDAVGDRSADEFAIPQASLVVEAPVFPRTKVHLQANFNADFETGIGPDPGGVDHHERYAGLIEVYSDSELALARQAFRIRVGAFVPPLSWEHPEPAWSTRYTLTPSAIATWAGEDLRTFGAEGSWKWQWTDHHASRLTAGIFSGDDQSGWVLLNRGWALHDYQPDLNYSYKLPSNEPIQPFKELDGHMGGYGRADLSFFDGLLEVAGGSWDNHADTRVQTLGSHFDAYHTKFQDYGGRVNYKRIVILAQRVNGWTESLNFKPGRSYRSHFVLASYELWRFQLAVRGDKFWVEKLEDGDAYTAALTYKAALRQHITAEYVNAGSKPLGAPNPKKVNDHLFSLNYRLRF